MAVAVHCIGGDAATSAPARTRIGYGNRHRLCSRKLHGVTGRPGCGRGRGHHDAAGLGWNRQAGAIAAGNAADAAAARPRAANGTRLALPRSVATGAASGGGSGGAVRLHTVSPHLPNCCVRS